LFSVLIEKYIVPQKIAFDSTEVKEKAFKYLEMADETINYNKDVHQMLILFWGDSAFQNSFKNREKLHLFDGAEYFLSKLKDLTPEYQMTFEDTLYTRRKTIGITNFEIEGSEKRDYILMVTFIFKLSGRRWSKKREKKMGKGLGSSTHFYLCYLS
jgi:hypothetical protein